jgi:hypothetical protein
MRPEGPKKLRFFFFNQIRPEGLIKGKESNLVLKGPIKGKESIPTGGPKEVVM